MTWYRGGFRGFRSGTGKREVGMRELKGVVPRNASRNVDGQWTPLSPQRNKKIGGWEDNLQ